MKYKNIACIADNTQKAQDTYRQLRERYDFIDFSLDPAQADMIIVLSGDGFMLHSLHEYMSRHIPLYGINCGTLGFLLNQHDLDNLQERIANAEPTYVYPLKMTATTRSGEVVEHIAFNEVSLMRQTYQGAKINIIIDEVEEICDLVCDGVLVATPAGSSAYNLSAHGPVVPLSSNLLALTPISPFRPKRWRGALLPNNREIRLDISSPDKRPVSATADFHEVRNVVEVKIQMVDDICMTLMFDPEHRLEDRLIKEQFLL